MVNSSSGENLDHHMFQAFVKMKPFSSYLSWLTFLATYFCQESICFLIPSSPSAWMIIHFHLVVLPFHEEPLWWVVLLTSIFMSTCFEKFHHDRNYFLPIIPLFPPGGVLFELFLDSLNMKMFLSTCLFEIINVNEKTFS